MGVRSIGMVLAIVSGTMKKIVGNITVPGDADVWPHEYETAVPSRVPVAT